VRGESNQKFDSLRRGGTIEKGNFRPGRKETPLKVKKRNILSTTHVVKILRKKKGSIKGEQACKKNSRGMRKLAGARK